VTGRVAEAARALRERAGLEGPVSAGIVHGSGLSLVRHHLAEAVEVPHDEVPNLPAPRVSGHHGSFALGRLGGRLVAASAGRCHAYEGHSMQDVAFGIRVMRELGASTVVLTSASGGIHPELEPGDLVLIGDHINLMGRSPLEGAAGGPAFVDMTECYDAALRARAHAVASSLGLVLREGVLAAVRGPQFETPAEVRMLRTLGADLVCMSLVPEAIVARSVGMSVLGLSVVANPAAGLGRGPIVHDAVLDVVASRADDVARLLAAILAQG
jgi:purine-nucleoside phosphorylase